MTIARETVYFTAITGVRSAEIFGLGKSNGLKQFQQSAANAKTDFGPVPLQDALLIPQGSKVACLGNGSNGSGGGGASTESNDVQVRTEDPDAETATRAVSVEHDDGGGIGVFEILSTIVTLIATIVGIIQLKS